MFELLQKEVQIVFCLESGYKNKPVTGVPSGGWTQINSPKYSGEAIITSLSVSAPDADNATFSAEFTGIGPLTTASTAGTFASTSK